MYQLTSFSVVVGFLTVGSETIGSSYSLTGQGFAHDSEMSLTDLSHIFEKITLL